VRLREFKERKRLDEVAQILLPLFALLGAAGATISQPKVEKWVKDNPKQAKDFVDAVKPQVQNPQSITNPVGNALVKSWNWLTGGSTQKDEVLKNQPPLSVPFKDRDPKEIKDKVNYDQYLNTTQGSTTADKLPPSTINNIRSSGDAGAGWVKQYDELYKKRSQINKQIAADIKNGLTKQQLDAKYGDNLQNLNRNLNDHLGKVDDFPQSKALKDLETRKIKTLPIKGLDIKNIDDDKISINGKTYDKDFDKAEIDSIIKNQQRKQQGQLSSVGTVGGVSGKGKQGTEGGALGGNIGTDIPWDGGVSGSSSKGKSIGSTDKGDGTITGPEIGIKGQTVVGQGAQAGTKGEVGAISQGSTISNTIPNIISRATPIPAPPGTIPPPIAQAPQGPKYRKYDPKKDKDIIYKGKVAPKNVVDFKAIKTGVGGMADRLRLK
jgi:hypothetical protein